MTIHSTGTIRTLSSVFITLFFLGPPAAGQSTGTLTGQVRDAADIPLEGVNVTISGTSLGTATGPDGGFRIEDVPTGRHTLVAQFVGYDPARRSVTVTARKTTRVQLTLHTRPLEMNEVAVEASRTDRPTEEIARAVSVVKEATIRRQSNGVHVDNSLNLVPGVKSLNRMGTDDSRFVMRGMGARNAWGINGVEVLIDGVPLSGLTGNTRVESFSANAVERIEVTRGPSTVWGGGTIGGVVNFVTKRPDGESPSRVTLRGGSHGFKQVEGQTAGLTDAGLGYALTADLTDQDGFRAHNNWSAAKLNADVYVPVLSEMNGQLRLFTQLNRNDVDEPGAITKEQAEADPTQANDFEREQDRGRTDKRGRLGGILDLELGPAHTVEVASFLTGRDIDHPLGFAYLDITTTQAYGRVKWTRENVSTGPFEHELMVATEVQSETNETAQHENNGGVQGTKEADTETNATSVGVFFQDHVRLTDDLTLTVGGRFDHLGVDVDDQFHDDNRDALEDSFRKFTVQSGLNLQVTDEQMVYTTVGQAFQPPTANQIEDAQRFTEETLDAQKALNLEVGSRGTIPFRNRRLRYDVALYTMRITDFINRIEVRENFTATTNDGKTRHRGVEIGLSVPLRSDLDLSVSYAFQDHFFTQGPNEDNQLPGVPRHQGSAEINWTDPFGMNGLNVSGFLNMTDKMYVDDEHSLINDAWTTLDLKMRYEIGAGLTPFLTVENVTGSNFVPDIDVNPQFGNDVFNPGWGRTVRAGVEWTF